ncbi:MAG: hypothetical protein H6934_03555 [Burkholderiaceae bacterium]|nr:hypothetical protein [Burkholderiaceae bacterium]
MAAATRPDLSNRSLRLLMVALLFALVAWLLARPFLPDAWQRPGTPVLQSLAALGAVLLLSPLVFALGKRSGKSAVPNRLFVGHVVASAVGALFVSMHAFSRLDGPPLLLLLCLLVLLATGTFARVHLSARMAATIGTKSAPFRPVPAPVREELAALIDRKTTLLRTLDPTASEALFSVTLRHWLRSPRQSLAYARLARREAELIGARASVSPLQAWWRPLHLLVAWLFLAGLAVHVIVVTFFAGYVAEGREIYWWHLAAW